MVHGKLFQSTWILFVHIYLKGTQQKEIAHGLVGWQRRPRKITNPWYHSLMEYARTAASSPDSVVMQEKKLKENFKKITWKTRNQHRSRLVSLYGATAHTACASMFELCSLSEWYHGLMILRDLRGPRHPACPCSLCTISPCKANIYKEKQRTLEE